MRTWVRVKSLEHCGNCKTELGQGMPMLALQLPKLKRTLFRCEDCAGPAPPDLAPHVPLNGTTKRMTPIAKAAPRLAKQREWMPFTDR